LLSIIRISTLLAPTALHRLAVDVRVVYSYNGVRGRLLGRKPGIEGGFKSFVRTCPSTSVAAAAAVAAACDV